MDQNGLRRRTNPDYTDVAYREAVSRLRYLLAESYAPASAIHAVPSRVSYSVPEYSRHQFSHARKGDDSGDETDFSAVQSERSATRPSALARPSFYGSSRPYVPPVSPYKATAARLGIGVTPAEGQQQGASKEGQQPPPELMAFIQRQEEYIDQLEKESQYCRDELSTLLGKVKEVIAENEDLHDKQKSGLMKSMFDYLDTEEEDFDDDDDDIGDEKDTSQLKGERKLREESKPTPKTRRLEGPSIVFESRITELEAQLSQSKIDLDKSKVECENLKKQLASMPSIQVQSPSPDSEAQVDTLRREKVELRDAIAKLQAVVTQLRESEAAALHKMKRAQDTLEQAQFEKNQGELEIHRLKDELDRQHQRLRDTIQDHGRKVGDERSAVERRFQAQIEQLNSELLNSREEIARLTLELERQRRAEADAKRELSMRASSGDELHRELQAKIAQLQAELSSAASARGAVEQEASGARFAAERSEREARAEAARLGAEVVALRQRLERTDSELLRSREENLRLSEQISSIQRELTLSKLSRGGPDKGYSEDSAAAEKREKEVSAMIQEMEAKHVQTVTDLEGMIQSQNQVVAKLKDECHLLTQKLEDASARHKDPQGSGCIEGIAGQPFLPPLQQPKKVKVNVTVKVSRKGVTKPKRNERAAMRNDNGLMAEKLKSIWRVSESLQAQCLEHTALYNQMSQRLEEMEGHEKQSSDQIYKLLTNQSKLLREREIMMRKLTMEAKGDTTMKQPPLTAAHHLPSLLNLPIVSPLPSTNKVPKKVTTRPDHWKEGWLPQEEMTFCRQPKEEEMTTTTWAEVRAIERDEKMGSKRGQDVLEDDVLPTDGYPVDVAGPLTLEDLATVRDT